MNLPKLISFCFTPGEFEAFLALCKTEYFRDYELIIYSPRGTLSSYRDQLLEFNRISNVNYNINSLSFINAVISILWTKIRSPKSICLVTLNVFDRRHSYLVRAVYGLLANGVYRDALNHYSVNITRRLFSPYKFYTEKGFNEVFFKDFNVIDCGYSYYNELLRKYLSRKVKKTNEYIFVISKSTIPTVDDMKKIIVERLKSKFHIQDIRIKPHPRENISWIESLANDKKIQLTQGFYEEVLSSHHVFIFGGSSGSLSKYIDNITYLDFPEFNRNTPPGRFDRISAIKTIHDLDAYLDEFFP